MQHTLSRHWLHSLAIAVLLALAGMANAAAPLPPPGALSGENALKLIRSQGRKLAIIDVRTPAELDQGHRNASSRTGAGTEPRQNPRWPRPARLPHRPPCRRRLRDHPQGPPRQGKPLVPERHSRLSFRRNVRIPLETSQPAIRFRPEHPSAAGGPVAAVTAYVPYRYEHGLFRHA